MLKSATMKLLSITILAAQLQWISSYVVGTPLRSHVNFNTVPLKIYERFNSKVTNRVTRFRSGFKLIEKSLQLSSSLIASTDAWALWACIAASAATALKLERTTKIGGHLSGPVCAMLLTVLLTNFNILPSGGSIYLTELQSFVVKLATPLLLFGADLRKIFRETGDLMKSFLLGTLGTLLGSSIGYLIFAIILPLNLKLPIASMLDIADSWKICGALTAKNIGGGLNFMAVADILKISPITISLGLAVDNLLGLLYFPLISSLGTAANTSISEEKALLPSNPKDTPPKDQGVSPERELESFSTALAVGLVLAAVSDKLGVLLHVPSIAMSTGLTVVAASTFTRQFKAIASSGELLGKILLLLFFASIGNSSGNIANILRSPGVVPLVGFEAVLYTVRNLLFCFYRNLLAALLICLSI